MTQGGGLGFASDSNISGDWTGWNDATHPFEFRNCQVSSLHLNCGALGVAMDSATMVSFGQTDPFSTLNSTVNAIASLDSEIQFVSGPDAAHTFPMNTPNHVIIGDGAISVNRVYKLDSTGGIAKQLFVIDNYGQGAQVAIEQVDNTLLYTFTNPAATHVRATFQLTNVGANTFSLFSVEQLAG